MGERGWWPLVSVSRFLQTASGRCRERLRAQPRWPLRPARPAALSGHSCEHWPLPKPPWLPSVSCCWPTPSGWAEGSASPRRPLRAGQALCLDAAGGGGWPRGLAQFPLCLGVCHPAPSALPTGAPSMLSLPSSRRPSRDGISSPVLLGGLPVTDRHHCGADGGPSFRTQGFPVAPSMWA